MRFGIDSDRVSMVIQAQQVTGLYLVLAEKVGIVLGVIVVLV
jgi:hypothetical protein